MEFKQTIDVDVHTFPSSRDARIYVEPRDSVDRKTAELACCRDDVVGAAYFNMPRTSCG